MSANTLFCGQGGSWPSSPEDSLSQRKLRHMSWQKAPGAYGSDPSVGVGGPGHALHDEVAARRQQGRAKAADQAAAGRLVHGVRRPVPAEDRKRVVEGTGGSVRFIIGGGRTIKQKQKT